MASPIDREFARIARLPQCCDIEPFRDVSEALGWLYVIERSTLLHDNVRRHLEIGIDSLIELRDSGESVKHLRFE